MRDTPVFGREESTFLELERAEAALKDAARRLDLIAREPDPVIARGAVVDLRDRIRAALGAES